jgi:hypothetical protein
MSRWHNRTPGAPQESGDSWVVTREIPGNQWGQTKVTEYLTGDTWTPAAVWKAASDARVKGTATQAQQDLLSSGHFPAN